MQDILSVCVTAATATYAQVQFNLRDEVTAWVGLICTIAVTVVTCAINVYRLWRDRDTDKKQKEQEVQVEDKGNKDE